MRIHLFRRSQIQNLCLALVSLTLANCSKPSQKFTGSKTSAAVSGYTDLINSSPEDAEARIESNIAKTFVETNEEIMAFATDEAFSIEGYTFDGILSTLEENVSVAEFLDDKYGSLNEYFAENNMDPYAEVSSEDIKETIEIAYDLNTSSGAWGEFAEFVDSFESDGGALLLAEKDDKASNQVKAATEEAKKAKDQADKKKQERCSGNYDTSKTSPEKLAAIVAQRREYQFTPGTSSAGKSIAKCDDGSNAASNPLDIGYGTNKKGESCQYFGEEAHQQIETLSNQLMKNDAGKQEAYKQICG